jgi:copper chaperone CopZ
MSHKFLYSKQLTQKTEVIMKSHATTGKKGVNFISRKDLQSGRSLVYNSIKTAVKAEKVPQKVKIAPKPVQKPQPKPVTKQEVVDETIEVIEYSEKAIAVIGNTKPIKNELAELKGRFNRFLTVDGVKTAGWIFAKTRQAAVESFLESL